MSAGTVALVLLAWTGAYLDEWTPNNHRSIPEKFEYGNTIERYLECYERFEQFGANR